MEVGCWSLREGESTAVGRRQVADWMDRFFDAYYSGRPANATFIGVHDHDHRPVVRGPGHARLLAGPPPADGRLFVPAMFARDYPLLMGILLLGSFMVVFFNLVASSPTASSTRG